MINDTALNSQIYSKTYYKSVIVNYFFLLWKNKFKINLKDKVKPEINFIFFNLFIHGKMTLVNKFNDNIKDKEYFLYPFESDVLINPMINPNNINLRVKTIPNGFVVIPPDDSLKLKYPFLFIRSDQNSPLDLISGEISEIAYLYAIIRANSFNLLNKKFFHTNETDKRSIQLLEQVQLNDTSPIGFVSYLKSVEALNPSALNNNMKITNTLATNDIFFSIQKLISSAKTKIGIFSLETQKTSAQETDNQVAMNQLDAMLISADEITNFNFTMKNIEKIEKKYKDLRIEPKDFDKILNREQVVNNEVISND